MFATSRYTFVFSLLVATTTLLTLTLSAEATEETRTQLLTYFETGDIPTEEQFADLIDSYIDLQYNYGTPALGHSVTALTGGISTNGTGWSIGHEQGAAIGPGLTYESTGSLGAGTDWPGFSGYLGFQFEIQPPGLAPTTHYGFVQMSVDGPADPTPYAIHITGIAYESTPNTAITTFFIPVPEPAGLILAALGVIPLLVRARRRRPR